MAADVEAWGAAHGPNALGLGEVHVWRARLDLLPAQLRDLEGLLDDKELDRANRFRFLVHRNRYVARRGILRKLLSRYLHVSAKGIALEYTRFGKPFLAKQYGSDICFNASHSQNLALMVLTREREVGIDLERVQVDFVDHAIPEQFFTPRETAILRALPTNRQPEAFFELWVRKEAYVKGRGTGLSIALDSFEVSFGDGAPARLLRTEPDVSETKRWTMVALHPAADYTAALVIEGRDYRLGLWTWSWAPCTNARRLAEHGSSDPA